MNRIPLDQYPSVSIEMIRIMVIGNLEQRIADQIHFCKCLKQREEQFHFLFALEDINLESYLKETEFCYITIGDLERNRNTASVDMDDSVQTNHPVRVVSSRFSEFKRRFRSSTLKELLYLYGYKKELKKQLHYCQPVFDQYQPSIILANGDRTLGIEQVLLKLAKERKVPVVIPYLVYSSVSFGSRRNNPLFEFTHESPFILRWVMNKFPAQVYSYEKRQIVFYQPSVMLALNDFGSLSEFPWYNGNGLSDVVCVDNIHSFNRYANHRVPKKKLVIVGDIADDRLFGIYKQRANVKSNIARKYRMDEGKKIIIAALPQLAEHNLTDWHTHWKEIDFLVDHLSRHDQNLLISLHPKMNKSQYEYLEDEYGCQLLDERLFDVLPVADLFVATFSSTVIWAVLCGINTIAVDFYGLNYDIFDFLKTVAVVRQRDSLDHKIREYLDSDLDFSEDWQNLSRDKVFSGGVINAYRRLILEITCTTDKENSKGDIQNTIHHPGIGHGFISVTEHLDR